MTLCVPQRVPSALTLRVTRTYPYYSLRDCLKTCLICTGSPSSSSTRMLLGPSAPSIAAVPRHIQKKARLPHPDSERCFWVNACFTWGFVKAGMAFFRMRTSSLSSALRLLSRRNSSSSDCRRFMQGNNALCLLDTGSPTGVEYSYGYRNPLLPRLCYDSAL